MDVEHDNDNDVFVDIEPKLNKYRPKRAEDNIQL